MDVFLHASVPLLILNFVKTLSKKLWPSGSAFACDVNIA